MSSGWGVDNINDILALAVRVNTAYKNAPNKYTHIAEEVNSLQIGEAARHFRETTLSGDVWRDGQEILEGCRGVLENLDSLLEKYQRLASTNPGEVFKKVQLGIEDITTLRARLKLHTKKLNDFIQSCEFLGMQAELTTVLGLNQTKVPIDTISSFVKNTNTTTAFRKFCRDLYRIGVNPQVISQKEKNILSIFNRSIAGQSQLPADRPRFRPPIDYFVGPSMLTAAETGNIQRLIYDLKDIRNINFEDDDKETALHKAAEKGHQDIVEQLLGKKASVEVTNSSNNTPLHLATRGGHITIVELLLKESAPIEAKNRRNFTPLHFAAQNGHISTVKRLLEKGASIEAMAHNNDTVLHLATVGCHTPMVELLLDKGASIDVINKDSNTPLHIAARTRDTDLTRLLLEKGAWIQAINAEHQTPLHFATETGHDGMVELLLEKGASIQAKNKGDNTPLHLAAKSGHTSIVELLLGKNASIETTNGYRQTPLHLAAKNGHVDIVKILLGKNASIEATNCYRQTPLHLAAEAGHVEVVKLLQNKVSKVNGNSP